MDNADSKLEACDASVCDVIWTSGGGVLIQDICWLLIMPLFQAAFEGLHKKVCNLWRSQTSDGAWVVYRPAGKAGKDTLPTTATVEINNSSAIQSINSGKNLKLKFPKE